MVKIILIITNKFKGSPVKLFHKRKSNLQHNFHILSDLLNLNQKLNNLLVITEDRSNQNNNNNGNNNNNNNSRNRIPLYSQECQRPFLLLYLRKFLYVQPGYII